MRLMISLNEGLEFEDPSKMVALLVFTPHLEI
jgi:hypothetical protein